MENLKIGEVIGKRRRELGLTQNQLAQSLNISFQAVSKWENAVANPDIEMLPRLAAALNTTVDGLLGYKSPEADYDRRYKAEDYYWGLLPNSICYDIMKILPPVKPYRVLDIGCGEGKDAVFMAKCGYLVTAFDLSEQGIDKAKRLAEHNKAEVNFFKADIFDYRPERAYDIIFSSGVIHILPETMRKEFCDSLKLHTEDNGINVLNVFVQKPFIAHAPDSTKEEDRYPWYSGELFGYYRDWLIHTCREDIFDCNSGGTPHKHCMDTMIARKFKQS
ncbi:MAG: methyltransferase domain-containing protein [Lachnospiraceae bacterium]|jgi:tellurite methyltransferase|uniref:methyltransferase domain-containing protein n=1 Tax=Parablautia intestinalis TaxID=2320100 RepID=UPI00256E9AB5|nr:methyltransferase domain-containing protein [Parablautia intestinalis]MCI8613714.1 methyltransferase domain-containing protein [Lachnospiraceae bacterium]